MKKTPKLRFKEFSGDWESKKVASVFDRVSKKVDVIENEYYEQIGIRSHGKGIFYKEAVSGKEIGNKRVFFVEPDVFVVNIVFAWEQAIAKTTQNEVGMIASHRFPMYKPKKNILDLDYITQLFKTPKGKFLLGLASPGGAGRNKTLGQKEFDDLDVVLPSYDEQKKISTFIALIDKRIMKQVEKVEALKDYKKGMMQKIFSMELRFKDDNDRDYPDWEETKLESIVIKKKKGKNPVYSGIGNILLNNEYMENNTQPLYVENEIDVNVQDILILWDGSQAGKMYTGFTGVLGSTFIAITLDKHNCNRFVYHQLMYNLDKIKIAWREGSGVPHVAKDFIEKFRIKVPGLEEQRKISKVLDVVDIKLKKEQEKLDSLNEYKKGLLQQMLV